MVLKHENRSSIFCNQSVPDDQVSTRFLLSPGCIELWRRESSRRDTLSLSAHWLFPEDKILFSWRVKYIYCRLYVTKSVCGSPARTELLLPQTSSSSWLAFERDVNSLSLACNFSSSGWDWECLGFLSWGKFSWCCWSWGSWRTLCSGFWRQAGSSCLKEGRCKTKGQRRRIWSWWGRMDQVERMGRRFLRFDLDSKKASTRSRRRGRRKRGSKK